MQKITSLIEEIKHRGYAVPDVLIPSKNLQDLNNLLKENNILQKAPLKISQKKSLEQSREFLNRHFILQRVPFYKEIKIGPIRFELSGDTHPFGIPIVRIKEDDFFGFLSEVVTKQDNMIKSIQYKNITLPKKVSELTTLSYTHELTHSQVNHIPGLIEDYNNIEVLSIFLELLNAYEISDSLLKIHDFYRLDELSSLIEQLIRYQNNKEKSIQETLIEETSYVKSTIKAYKLFFLYLKGNDKIRKEILNNIQKIFNQEKTLESVLSLFDITFEDYQENQEFSKYLHR